MRYSVLFTVLAAITLLVACQPARQLSPDAGNVFQKIIPSPVSVKLAEGNFIFGETTAISYDGSEALAGVAMQLQSLLADFDIRSELKTVPHTSQQGIHVTLDDQLDSLGAEGYILEIDEQLIKLNASKPSGIFYASQTLKQLISFNKTPDGIALPAATVIDYPRYAWRGSMLDVARHFFSVDEVKKYIDYLASHKLNVLHLHLTDDQGWRIEIKSWPNLTQHGATTEVNGGEGGFYTQEQYKEIVQYAAERFIIVVPEIDMPGHTNAALASYPELNCTGVAPALYTGIEVGFSTLCLHKEVTFKFVDDVIRELAELTPTPYIHVGGDEAAATPKEDYIQFINRFRQIVKSHGKVMIGWEEIAQGSVDSTDIAQHWHSADMASSAATKGAAIILSPAIKIYLDMQYDSSSRYGLHWAAFVEVDESFNWNPDAWVPGLAPKKILGIEAPLWSETISNLHEAEYLLFPRLLGVAEKAWSPQSDWNTFRERLAHHAQPMESKGINFYRSPRVTWLP